MKLIDLTKTYSGLPKSIYVIFIARVVNCIGNFVFPFLTLLLTVKLGMSEKEAGFILFICAIVQAPGSLIGGKFADHFGRKRVIITFMSLSALCFIICAFLRISVVIADILILSSFFNSIAGPASGAMVNDLTVSENRQAAFSLLYLGVNIGTALGSIIAGYLFNNHMMILYLGDAITTILAVILIIIYVPETKPTEEQIQKGFSIDTEEKSEEGGLISALIKRPALLAFAFVSIIYSFAYVQSHFSLPLQTKYIFGQIKGPQILGMLNMVNCIVVITMTSFITAITKNIKDIFKVSFAGVFYALGFGMLFFIKSLPLFVISTVIWTIGEILNAISSSVYIANHTPISHRGRFNSIISIISGTGFAVGPMIAGKFISNTEVKYIWPIIFVLVSISAFFMFLLGQYENRKILRQESLKYYS